MTLAKKQKSSYYSFIINITADSHVFNVQITSPQPNQKGERANCLYAYYMWINFSWKKQFWKLTATPTTVPHSCKKYEIWTIQISFLQCRLIQNLHIFLPVKVFYNPCREVREPTLYLQLHYLIQFFGINVFRGPGFEYPWRFLWLYIPTLPGSQLLYQM